MMAVPGSSIVGGAKQAGRQQDSSRLSRQVSHEAKAHRARSRSGGNFETALLSSKILADHSQIMLSKEEEAEIRKACENDPSR